MTRESGPQLAQKTILRENSLLDTRSKIITAVEAKQRLQEEPDLLAIRANLDPVYAPHAQALQAFGKPLLIILADKADSYLSLSARAEMAASLAAARYVVTEAIEHPNTIDLRPQEAQWCAELEEVVLRKSAIPETKAT